MNWSIDTKISTGFALALALLVIVAVISYVSIGRLTDTIGQVTHTHAVIDTLEDLFSELKDAQRGERGFVLTGVESYLTPYNEALILIDEELRDLQQLVANDESQEMRLAGLRTVASEKLAELKETIDLRRNEGFDASVRAIRSGEGKQLMDAIERLVIEMQAEEELRLDARVEQARARARVTLLVIGAGSLIELGLVILSMLLVHRDITMRKRAERELQDAHAALENKVEERTAELVRTNEQLNSEIRERERNERQLAVILQQIEKSRDDLQFIFDQLRLGTAMIDGSGRISFLSKIARSWFNKQLPDVVGRHWEDVFVVEDKDKAALSAMLALPSKQRMRLPVGMEASDGRRFRMQIEILDDPRTKNGKILSLYDVSEIYDLRRLLDEKANFENMIGKSSLMRRVFQQIQSVASVDSTVLILGETGTGKELVAGALHSLSHRKDGPFVPVNCAGLTDSLLTSQLFGHRKGAFTGAVADQKGLFEAAEGGTLFLDEIGDISIAVQTSLLRVLQEKEITRLGDTSPAKINVRIIAATHRDLEQEIKEGRFRADLFYRIRVARIDVPPLRARREDIPLLAEWFLRQSRATTGKPVQDISGDAMRLLMDHPWPGNVRELNSVVEFAVIRCKDGILRPGDFPPEIGATVEPFGEIRDGERLQQGDDEERRLLSAALEKAGGNRAAAARLLGIGRTTLYRRLAALNIDRA